MTSEEKPAETPAAPEGGATPWTTEEAAAFARVGIEYMKRLFRAGLIVAADHGGKIGYLTTDKAVQAWVAAGMPPPPPKPWTKRAREEHEK